MGAILYRNYFREAVNGEGTLSAIGTVSGGMDAATDSRTGTSETFATGANREVTVQPSIGNSKVNCVGIARHNLLDAGATITVLGSNDNSIYTTLFSTTADNATFNNTLFYVDSSDYTYSYYRVRVSGHSVNVFMTDLAIGEAIRLERDQYYGFVAPEFADGDRIRANMTRGQNLAGLTVDRMPKRVRLDLKYYTRAFYDNWLQFVLTSKKHPFYLSWAKNDDEEKMYCWFRNKIPQPKFSKKVINKEYLDVRMDLEGITY